MRDLTTQRSQAILQAALEEKEEQDRAAEQQARETELMQACCISPRPNLPGYLGLRWDV